MDRQDMAAALRAASWSFHISGSPRLNAAFALTSRVFRRTQGAVTQIARFLRVCGSKTNGSQLPRFIPALGRTCFANKRACRPRAV